MIFILFSFPYLDGGLKNGSSNNKRGVNDIVEWYWDVHDEILGVNGILFRNERLVISESLLKGMARQGRLLLSFYEGDLKYLLVYLQHKLAI